MALKITFLGTGGAFTDFRVNYHNNAAVHVGGGKVVLLDCGGTAVQALKELGVPVGDVSAVCVTHLHGDHVGGIEQLAWERFYTGPAGPAWARTVLATPDAVAPGLRSVLEPCVDELTSSEGVARSGGFDGLFDLRVGPSHADKGSSDASPPVGFWFVRTPHVVGPGVDKPAFGVRLMEMGGGPVAYYTSDTTFQPDVAEKHRDAVVIFHDCTFSPRYPGTVHTHYDELLTLPPEVRGRIVLMHHTRVPDGADVRRDGFLWAASRFDHFEVSHDRVRIGGPGGGGTFRRESDGTYHMVSSVRTDGR